MSIINLETKNLVELIDFTQLKNKKVLVTGASGLVGIYLISTLKQIYIEYNISIYAWTKNTIDPNFLEIFNDCNLIIGDITDSNYFNDLPMFDFIIHSAGYGQPTKFLQDKLKTIQLNTTSTINLFNKLEKNGKFLFISTSEVYSGIESENIFEYEIGNTNPSHPRASYIESKRCGETICHSYISNGYDVKIVRLSLAYGPGTKKDDNRVINQLIQKGLLEDEIKLMDSGSAIRTYCYISDVIEMFFNVLFNGKDILYNIGGDSKISILELAYVIGNKLDKKVILPEKNNELVGNPKLVNISRKKYFEEFGEKEFLKIEEGIQRTIEWQKLLYAK